VVGPLPVEEMLFFLATNVSVAGGVMLLFSPESMKRVKKLLATFRKPRYEW
jgi:hypothetical protein